MSRDPRIDRYIEQAPDFARLILQHLRLLVHAACPSIEEGIKWGRPAFLYKGRILAGMSAFKEHATFGFWHGAMVTGSDGRQGAMGQLGRLCGLADLPEDDEIRALVGKAMTLIDQGARPKRTPAPPRPPAEPGADFAAALQAAPAAARHFEALSPSSRREYVEWIEEAKRPETRARRIAEAIAWISEGKKRNWKYER